MNKSHFEVIVVSDGPDKETLIVLMSWLKKNELNLKLLQTPIKKGPASARNYGWLEAKSNLIAFTDDDCIPDPNWLNALNQLYSGQKYVALSGLTKVPLPHQPTDYAINTSGLETAEFITANCACTKNALFQVGGFDERFEAAWREDSDLHFKFLEADIPILKVSQAIVYHPVRKACWGVSLFEQKKAQYDVLLYQKYPTLFRLKIETAPIWNYYLINSTWIALFIALYYRNDHLTLFFSSVLIVLITTFIIKRLKNTKKSTSHILEMISTSIIIPSLSVFWRIYGAIKFKVIFI